MDHEKNNIRKNWALIETTISANWPEEWLQANPLEIKALEEIIDNHKSLNEEITEVPGGMGCDFCGFRGYILFAGHPLVPTRTIRTKR